MILNDFGGFIFVFVKILSAEMQGVFGGLIDWPSSGAQFGVVRSRSWTSRLN